MSSPPSPDAEPDRSPLQPSDVPVASTSAPTPSSAPPPGPPAGPVAQPKRKFQPIQLQTAEHIYSQDLMDNCFVKTTIAGVMGAALGVAFGVFSASIDNAGGGLEPVPLEPQKTTRVVLKEMWTNIRSKSTSYAKGFALFGAVYSMNECVIEKYRAKHDRWNAAYAGCATGGMLAVSGGPKAMCMGCASFAAFSSAIEYFMDT